MSNDDRRLEQLIELTHDPHASDDELYELATSIEGGQPLETIVHMSLDRPNDRLLLATSVMLQSAVWANVGLHQTVTKLALQFAPVAVTASNPRVPEFLGATFSTLANSTWLDGLNARDHPQLGALLITCLSRRIPEAPFYVASVIWTGRAAELLSTQDREIIRHELAEILTEPHGDFYFPDGINEFIHQPERDANTPGGAFHPSPTPGPSIALDHGYAIEPLSPSVLADLDIDGHLRIQDPWIMRATLTDGRVVDPLVVELYGSDGRPEDMEMQIDELFDSTSTLMTGVVPASQVARLEPSRFETTRELEDAINVCSLKLHPWQWFIAEMVGGTRVTLARRLDHYWALPLPEPWSVADVRRILPIPDGADDDLRTEASADVDVCVFRNDELVEWLDQRLLADWWA